jgi:hypothetical protein
LMRTNWPATSAGIAAPSRGHHASTIASQVCGEIGAHDQIWSNPRSHRGNREARRGRKRWGIRGGTLGWTDCLPTRGREAGSRRRAARVLGEDGEVSRGLLQSVLRGRRKDDGRWRRSSGCKWAESLFP